ncbi:MAG: DUF819 family protein [Planctomycetales bacterium]|nr:DUF819 family protein [Planctomycetales bacterium]
MNATYSAKIAALAGGLWVLSPPALWADEASAGHSPLIQSDAVILGILLAILGFVFWSSSSPLWGFRAFYRLVPMLLLCYFLPSLLTFFHWVDPHQSQLYFVASRYLLPASLVLLTLSVELREIVKLGPKALIMFLTGTAGVIVGGPLSILLVGWWAPEWVGGDGPEAVWRGMTTVAGSWIGGGANQAAMKEIFQPSDELYSVMVAVDVLVAEFWMMFLLLGIGKAEAIDRFFRADASSVERLRQKMEAVQAETAHNPSTSELFMILAVGFGGTAVAHAVGDALAPWIATHAPQLSRFSLDSSFFWLIVVATAVGVGLSFTPLRKLEGAGASKIGTLFIFILVATIGLGMDISAVIHFRSLFVVGLVWMSIHVGLLLLVGYLIRAPYFFLAVGSKANIGGAASAPVIAAAFHPTLAPVGVLLAVLGYVLGTYGAWLCGLMMQAIAAQ